MPCNIISIELEIQYISAIVKCGAWWKSSTELVRTLPCRHQEEGIRMKKAGADDAGGGGQDRSNRG